MSYTNTMKHIKIILRKRLYISVYRWHNFYQRPLKSKKSLISNCSLEFRTFKVDGVERHEGIKCISKSNPIYQEFRLLQWMKNLKIFKKDDRQDIDITDELLPNIAEREKLLNG